MSYSNILGWFNFADLYDEIASTCPEGGTIVEVGVACGRSIAYLARKVIETGRRIRIVAVDPWDLWGDDARHPDRAHPTDADLMGWHGRHHALWDEHGSTFRVFLASMLRHAPEEIDRISVVRMYSTEAARLFVDRSVHAVFIDADHSYAGVRADLAAWSPKVSHDGIFAGHDLDDPEVRRAMDDAYRGRYRQQGTCWRVS